MKDNAPTKAQSQIDIPLRSLGTGTWNDEQTEDLIFNGADSESYRQTVARRHLRKDLSSQAEYDRLRTAMIDRDRAAVAAEIRSLKTGEVLNGVPLDALVDSVADEFIARGGTEWTIALTRDASIRNGTTFFFEIYRKVVVR